MGPKMKLLLLVALAAAAVMAEPDAEASPESWYYGYYGHPYRYWGYGYRGYYGYPYRYWWKRSAEEQQPESQHIVKRSADADADASPESWYYGYYGHPYRWGGYYRGYYGYGYPGYYWG